MFRILILALAVLGLVTAIRLFKRFWAQQLRAGSQSSASPGTSRSMSRQDALEVLGLSDGASRDDILRAYRELMRKVHPDSGGSDYLASKLNQAKDVLLR